MPNEVVCVVCAKAVTPVTDGVREGEKSFHLSCYHLYRRSMPQR